MYSQVPRQRINNVVSSNAFVTRERDPQSIALEQNVFGKMNEVSRDSTPKHQKPIVPDVNFVSVEDAIRELSDISKSGNDIS